MNWLNSYLSNRKQYVNINNIDSNFLDVLCGVPQGSILGPKLFILYINDLCNVSSVLKFILFADDTNIFFTGNDVKSMSKTISVKLNKLYTWFCLNKLSLNVSKTNFMIFNNSRTESNVNIFINETAIEQVTSTKFLGVLIDNQLTWKLHISRVKNKLIKCVAILFKVRHLLCKESLYLIYCSLFLSYMTYCVEIWGNTYKSNIQQIYITQKKTVRVIWGATYREHTANIFSQLKIIKFFDLVKLRICTIVYKACNRLLPPKLLELLSFETSTMYRTRNSGKLKCKYARTNKKSMCLSICGISMFNNINKEIVNCRNVRLFNKMYKKFILNSYVN